MTFGAAVRRSHDLGHLVVQARMGLADPQQMAAGLRATRDASARTVGTITIDSYTRLGETAAVAKALREGAELNGYPLVHHGAAGTRRMLEGIAGPAFPIQVRHGSARPLNIVRTMCAAGLSATEGGPVSYCLPYGIVPLAEALSGWDAACRVLAQAQEDGSEPHIETFGGCLLGQLCPPSLLVAISVLEAMYFASRGLRSVSLSYAQQTHPAQDREAIHALRTLASQMLPDLDWHIVVYAYMGVFPRTAMGARSLLAAAAELAVDTGSERLIVKTVAEAFRLPSVAENVEALEFAADVAWHRQRVLRTARDEVVPGEVYAEAAALIDAVRELGPDVGRSLVTAFQLGLLDVPYCLHPDNAGQSRSYLDSDGRLRWSRLGSMPLGHVVTPANEARLTANSLLSALSFMQRSYDAAAINPAAKAVSARSNAVHPSPAPKPLSTTVTLKEQQ